MEITKIDKTKSLRQSNRLIEARYTLTKYEQRMIMAICSQIDQFSEDFHKVRVSVADMADFCNIKKTNKYGEVNNIINSLLDRKLYIYDTDGNWYKTHWLQSAKYIKKEGYIEYKLDSELKDDLLQLKSAFLSTKIEPLMEFKRDYSVRMYFILKKMLKIKEFDYNLSFFRDTFQLGETYNKISNLKNRILEPALKEINEKSDIKVTHKYVKEGRIYTKIHFIVTLKEKSPKEKLEAMGQLPLPLEVPPKKKKELDEDSMAVLKNLLDRGIGERKAKALVKKYSPARIRENIATVIGQKDTAKNIKGLIVKAIEEDYAGQNKQAKKEIAEQEEAKRKDKKQAKEFFEGKQDKNIDMTNTVIMKNGKYTLNGKEIK